MTRKAPGVSNHKAVSRSRKNRSQDGSAAFAKKQKAYWKKQKASLKKQKASLKKQKEFSNKQKNAVTTKITKPLKKKGKKIQKKTINKIKRASGEDNVPNGNSSPGSHPTLVKLAKRKRRASVNKKKIDSKIHDVETANEPLPVCESIENKTAESTKSTDDPRIPGLVTAANDFPKSWTEEMIRYYFEPREECKNFDYVKILDNIEYKASDWWISESDRKINRGKRDFFQRCAKCNLKGHTKKECKKYRVCYVCGEFSHEYSRCPNTLCLTCGRATKKYSNNCHQCRKTLNNRKICTRCGQFWHEESLCPSNWRKYVVMDRSKGGSVFRLNSRKYCYNCAERGHFGFECPLALQSDYPPDNPLKTAFPLEQRCYCGKEDPERKCDCKNTGRVQLIDNNNFDPPLVHVLFITKEMSDVLSSEPGKHFLTNLSQNNNIRIELFRGKRSYIKLFGDLKVVEYCKCQLLSWKT